MADVKAELVGNLWKIVVEVGQAVEEDDTLMILEFDEDGDPDHEPDHRDGEADPRRRGRGGPGGSDGRRRRVIPDPAVTVSRRWQQPAAGVRP